MPSLSTTEANQGLNRVSGDVFFFVILFIDGHGVHIHVRTHTNTYTQPPTSHILHYGLQVVFPLDVARTIIDSLL